MRIVRVSAITDYTTGRTRDCTELVMYFDCVNSSPSGTEFAAGQSLEYCGETYEVVSAELFAGEDPHHWRVRRARPAGNISERRGGMAESTTKKNSAPDSSREESYRMAKLLRAGNRELARQLNLKKARR